MLTQSQVEQVEARLSALEQEVAQLRRTVDLAEKDDNWLNFFIGSFKNDQDFVEIVKLGREHRQSQRFETHG